MSEGQHHPKFDGGPVLLGLFGILCGVAIVSVVHYIAISWCSRRRNRLPRRAYPPHPNHHMSTLRTGNAISGLKVYVYSKEWKEGTCAVCLSEFVEGEEVRILPDCAHTFHMPCVDMWLYSHPNCPLCRTCTTPRGEHIAVSLPSSVELPPPVESLPSSGRLPTPLESFPRSAGLPSPVHNRVLDVDDHAMQL